MKGKYDKQSVTLLLAAKQDELKAAGEARLVQRSDFTDEEVCAIKAFLGPWPRALEEAGLKPCRSKDAAESSKAKRIEAKRKKNAAQKEQRKKMRPD